MNDLEKLETELKLRGFSPRTVQSYSYYNRKFLEYAKKQPSEVNEDDVKRYVAELMSRNISPKSIILVISALKFFYNETLKKDIVKIKSPKVSRKLPVVLTKEEVKILIDSLKNS